MQEFTTPMMKQYVSIKKQYQDCLLFYRMGDFYELFLEDAHTGARVLNITLTSRAKGKDGRIPMAGVPYHAVDAYLAKLVKAGFKVAICEQVSLPNKTGIIDRQVVRIVTPGTVLDENALEKKENNYIVALTIEKGNVGISISDVSTGYFASAEFTGENYEQIIADEFARIRPAECILPEVLYNNPSILQLVKKEKNINIFPFLDWEIYGSNAEETLKKHFGVTTLSGFGIAEKSFANQSAAALLGYLQQTQKGPVNHIKKITTWSKQDCLLLDRSTVLNLELFSTIREHDAKGTLLSVMDHTVTAMGGRLLKQWMRRPLLSKKGIEKRHDAVSELLQERNIRQRIEEEIKEVNDIERLLARCSVGLGNARDLVNLKKSLQTVVAVKDIVDLCKSKLLQELKKKILTDKNNSLIKLIALIQTTIVSQPPVSIREGGMIAEGIDIELDKLRKIVGGGKEWILELEKKERELSGIASLKVRFNQVFGFYIEVSKSNLAMVPARYMRKQTLVNAERFITPELKDQEEIILTAEEKMQEIELIIFQKILGEVLKNVAIIQQAAQSIAELDCLINFAYLADKRNYVRPKLQEFGEIAINNGRHPVVETLLDDLQFVPNDVLLDPLKQQLLIITGPNMAGKSVIIRQTALIVLMCQMGSFVPAQQATISLVDQIFVRSGASDVITSGLSTFMVEMVETAHILHNATEKSLIIMDEIGRGTSTYDGISIAWAVAEYLVKNFKNSPKTLFATHYHELQALEELYPRQIKNYHMSVANENGEPLFLHTIAEGGSSHSFGVAVAKLAGIPESVIIRARAMLLDLEKRSEPNIQKDHSFAAQNINFADHLIQKELEKIDISQMTPLEALNKLAELKEKLKFVQAENKVFIDGD